MSSSNCTNLRVTSRPTYNSRTEHAPPWLPGLEPPLSPRTCIGYAAYKPAGSAEWKLLITVGLEDEPWISTLSIHSWPFASCIVSCGLSPQASHTRHSSASGPCSGQHLNDSALWRQRDQLALPRVASGKQCGKLGQARLKTPSICSSVSCTFIFCMTLQKMCKKWEAAKFSLAAGTTEDTLIQHEHWLSLIQRQGTLLNSATSMVPDLFVSMSAYAAFNIARCSSLSPGVGASSADPAALETMTSASATWQ